MITTYQGYAIVVPTENEWDLLTSGMDGGRIYMAIDADDPQLLLWREKAEAKLGDAKIVLCRVLFEQPESDA